MTLASSMVRPLVRGIAQPVTGSEKTTRVFVLAGQSNMVGRAGLDAGPGYPEGVFQYTMAGEIVAATSPLDHHDENPDDMGLALQFAIDFRAAHPNEEIVFLPAAEGGSGFSDGKWRVGGALYNNLVTRANALFAANPSFRLGAILWHQGERDSGYASFESDLDAMIAGLRSEIAVAGDTTPFVLGELVPDFVEASAENGAINDSIKDTPNRVFHSSVVSSFLPTRLSDVGDNLHFDSASLRLLGSRYFSALSVSVSNRPVAPAAVSDLVATAGNQTVVLSWSAPADGGMPITDYRVERSLDGAAWTEMNDGVSGATGFSDSGLTNGVSYSYRVTAINSIGAGDVSNVATAVPEVGAVSVLSTAFDATTDNGTSHSFTGIDVGVGGTVFIAAATRASTTAKGLSGISIGGQAATLFARNESYGNYTRFGYVTDVPSGLVDIVLTHEASQSRAGIHVWVVKNADVAAAVASNAGGTACSIDATADGVVLGVATSINPPSQAIDWTGLDQRHAWTNYGDNFGSGAADRVFAADATGHEVTIATDGNYKMISLVSVPKP